MELTWKVDKTVSTPCPDYTPDPYTGEYPNFHCAVYHCKTITEGRSREVHSKKEATEFANNAPLSCYEFKLDGKLIKDTRKRPEYGSITDPDILTATDGTIGANNSGNILIST